MVKIGLKIGDTFTDGDFLYKINSIDSQGNYVSSLVGKAGEGAKAPKAETKERSKKAVKKEETESKEDRGV